MSRVLPPLLEPMKFQSMDVMNLSSLTRDENIVLEQKLDGTRALCHIKSLQVHWYNSGGRMLAHTAATQHLPHIEGALYRLSRQYEEIVLDGEIMIDTGEYWLFDLPAVRWGANWLIRPSDTLAVRRIDLEQLNLYVAGPVFVVSQAKSDLTKTELIKKATEAGAEGLMAKRLDSPYIWGQRVRHSLKAKFVRTADVVVEARTQNPNSIGMAVYDDEHRLIPVGSVSGIGRGEVSVGDVIEVRYDNFQGALLRPRMVRKRDDKEPEECGLDQFQTYSKAVL